MRRVVGYDPLNSTLDRDNYNNASNTLAYYDHVRGITAHARDLGEEVFLLSIPSALITEQRSS